MGAAFESQQVEMFRSGTMALAVAIRRAATRAFPGAEFQVALPAYGCPNLLSAVLWAGGKPVYYDLQPDNFSPSLESLACAIDSGSTIAVVVDAFGANSLDAKVQELSHERFVHDLAQSFAPYERGWLPASKWSVISTGRAKPLSLTLGGALLSSYFESELLDGLPAHRISALEFRLRSAAYSASLNPLLFSVLSRLPVLGIGATTFEEIDEVSRLDKEFKTRLTAAILSLRERLSTYAADTQTMVQLARQSGLQVAIANEAERGLPLWRVPVLFPTAGAAQSAYEKSKHLGTSRLYQRTVPEIIGRVPEYVAERWPNAFDLARRLLTLPTHGRLSGRQREHLGAILREARG